MLARLLIDNETSIFGGPLHGTAFSLEAACSRCGTGARQVGPLVLAASKFPRQDIFATLTGEVLVSHSYGTHLREAGIDCLGPVVRASRHEPLPVYQLVPQAELPSFDADRSAVVRERPCPQCGRDGFFDKPDGPMVLAYQSIGPALLRSDLLATYERFGNSRLRDPFSESVFARPALVVGDRFQTALAAKPVRGINLEPLLIGGQRES